VLRVGDVTQAFVDVRSTQAGLSNSARLSLNVQDVASLSIEPLRYNVLPNTEFAYLRDHVYGIVTLRSANDSKLGDNSMVIVGDGVSQERWDSFSYVGAAGTHTVQVAADSLSTIRTLSCTNRIGDVGARAKSKFSNRICVVRPWNGWHVRSCDHLEICGHGPPQYKS
jgi:hypothetical protein